MDVEDPVVKRAHRKWGPALRVQSLTRDFGVMWMAHVRPVM